MFIGTVRKILSDLLYKHDSFKKDNLTVIEYVKEIVTDLNAKEDEEVPTVIIEIFKDDGVNEKIIYKSEGVRLVIVNNIVAHVRTLGEKEIKSLEAKKADR